MSTTGGPAAGWYEDPTQPGLERWWDGQAWGNQTRAIGAAPPHSPPPIPQPVAGAYLGAEPGGPGVPHYGAQPVAVGGQPQKSGCFGIGAGVMAGIIGACVLLLGGCVAVVAIAANSGDDLVSVQTTTNASAETDEGQSTNDDSPVANATAGGDEAADVTSCTRIGPDTIVLDVVNNSPTTSSYFMTVGFFDESGQRLADESAFLNYLRPGERAIEEQFVFEEAGTTCEIIDVDRYAAESSAEELAEIGPCELSSEANVFGDFDATLAATNGSPETSDYIIEVAIVDPDGIRRGTGSAFIEAVRPGETAPSDLFSSAAFAQGYSCEVVGVTRNAS